MAIYWNSMQLYGDRWSLVEESNVAGTVTRTGSASSSSVIKASTYFKLVNGVLNVRGKAYIDGNSGYYDYIDYPLATVPADLQGNWKPTPSSSDDGTVAMTGSAYSISTSYKLNGNQLTASAMVTDGYQSRIMLSYNLQFTK